MELARLLWYSELECKVYFSCGKWSLQTVMLCFSNNISLANFVNNLEFAVSKYLHKIYVVNRSQCFHTQIWHMKYQQKILQILKIDQK